MMIVILHFLTGYVPEFSLAVEDKRRFNEGWPVQIEKTCFSQAYATAIVFSFLCHYKFGMKRSFRPTLLISTQGFAVFFYDCKEDIMISKYCLWSEYTLVLLWTVLDSLLTGSQQGRKKIWRASEWESERRDSASEASGTRGSL